MIGKFLSLAVGLLACCSANAQFAPQAGQAGTTAIAGTDSRFIDWATHCTVVRGYVNIAEPSLGWATAGDSSLAVGPADDQTVSLGDSGVAVLTFAHPIYDGPGYDFAVFENGFLNPADPTQAFLELGFVEVSSDGINYFRFPATSLTPDSVQVSTYGYMDAAKINNLAGKYIAMYGTPFDLAEMAGIPGLDIDNVNFVRVVDVIGAIKGDVTTDSSGRVVNDPYPTPFATCGFDLDAVGVINEKNTSVQSVQAIPTLSVYPNPASDALWVDAPALSGTATLTITDVAGLELAAYVVGYQTRSVSLANLTPGIYLATLQNSTGTKWTARFVKY
jgi:Secretion system C-terminal sorting domain